MSAEGNQDKKEPETGNVPSLPNELPVLKPIKKSRARTQAKPKPRKPRVSKKITSEDNVKRALDQESVAKSVSNSSGGSAELPKESESTTAKTEPAIHKPQRSEQDSTNSQFPVDRYRASGSGIGLHSLRVLAAIFSGAILISSVLVSAYSLSNFEPTTWPYSLFSAANNMLAFASQTPSSRTATVKDTTAPTISNVQDVVAEATGPYTKVSALPTPTVTDNSDPSPTLTANVPTDGFPLGTTMVTWTAVDLSGNTATATQKVTIMDTTLPVVTPPPDISMKVDYTGQKNVSVSLGESYATDSVDANPVVTNDAPTDGFPVGYVTTVTWTATDASGNSATATQKVSVMANINTDTAANTTTLATETVSLTTTSRSPSMSTSPSGGGGTTTPVSDRTAPVVNVPSNQVVEATSKSGAIVNYPPATATDNIGVTSGPSCTPASGSTFPLSSTTVTCTAKDAAGNVGTASFTVQVRDTTAPKVIAPGSIITKATGSLTIVSLGSPTVSDIADGSPVVTNNAPTSGFPIGNTTVTWKATDASGNSATATQLVSILVPSFTFCSSGCDYSNLQSAINALPSIGGKIYIGNGAYSMSKTIYLKSGTSLEFGTKSSIDFTPLGIPLFYGNYVNNISVNGGSITGQSGVKAFSFYKSSAIKMTGTIVQLVKGGASSAFQCIDCTDVSISNVYFKTATFPIYINTQALANNGLSSHIWLQNSRIEDASVIGVLINFSNDVHIIGNAVANTMDNGIDIGGNNNSEVRGNTITHTGLPNGVAIHTDSANGADIINNYIDTPGKTAIMIFRASHINVIGNTITKSGGNGIDIITGSLPSSYITVKSNHIIAPTGYGIWESAYQYQIEISYNTLEQIPTGYEAIHVVTWGNTTTKVLGNIIL
ncbi:MAG: HYR domain-containing protein [Thaumarchaeota archaeon]|nr:MAG: HYR domain-containing protein [Nitrososphaerota archaeon]